MYSLRVKRQAYKEQKDLQFSGVSGVTVSSTTLKNQRINGNVSGHARCDPKLAVLYTSSWHLQGDGVVSEGLDATPRVRPAIAG